MLIAKQAIAASLVDISARKQIGSSHDVLLARVDPHELYDLVVVVGITSLV